MNPTGNIIRDAWLFGLIPETETCEGWTGQGVDALYDKVTTEWEKYGHLVSNLPPELAYYHDTARELHNRLIGEFGKALDLLEQRHKDHGCEPRSKKVAPFPQS